MSRFEGGRPPLDYGRTLGFFEGRAAGAAPGDYHAVTVFSDADAADRRHAAEMAEVAPLLDLGPDSRVLDLGCGGGRWARTLVGERSPPVASYVGCDFSPSLIDLARGLNLGPHASFHVMGADALDPAVLGAGGPFSHVAIVGLCMYLNDETVAQVVETAAALAAPGALLYWREPVSLTGERLTLIDEFSEKIGADYHAVYRTPEDYDRFMAGTGAFAPVTAAFLSDPSFQRFTTTRHRYLVGRRL